MKNYRYGAVDIGSNALRLLIYNVIAGDTYKDALMNKLAYLRLPLRLGGDVFSHQRIGEVKREKLIDALKIYKNLLDFYEVDDYRACATSATRSASNGAETMRYVKDKIGLDIDIIDGFEEANLLYLTNLYNLPEGKTFLSADLGGGSLQITLFEGRELIWTHSYKIGTVRLMNNLVDEAEFTAFDEQMREIRAKYDHLKIIGSGGNINKISKLCREKTVERDDIEKLYKKLKPLSVEERMRKYHLRHDRADVIVEASEVYLRLLELLDKNKIYVPKIGLADGIIRELYEKHNG